MIVGILLAAGQGVRFGAQKLLTEIDGCPMVLHSARRLRDCLGQVVITVPPWDRALQQILEQDGFQVMPCAEARLGMGASLACAVAARARATGWIVGLADMPFVQPDTIRTLIRELERTRGIVAPIHQGRRGHPVGFDGQFSGELRALRGDIGARALLAAHAESLTLVPCADPGVLMDVDVPSDLLFVQ